MAFADIDPKDRRLELWLRWKAIAAQCGFRIAHLEEVGADNHYVCVPFSRAKSDELILSYMEGVVLDIDPAVETKVEKQTNLTVLSFNLDGHHEMRLVHAAVDIDAKALLAVLFIIVWYIHGWVVAPAWWAKLLCLFVLPAFYFSIESIWQQLIK